MSDNRKLLHEQPKLCDHILSSVKDTSVQLKIASSSIPNAGSGLFVANDVAAGSEIFRTQPLLMVCESNKSGICDWCFTNENSSLRPDGQFHIAGKDKRVQLSSCKRCKMVEYCSKECQALAWKAHHKYECSVMEEVLESSKNMGAFPQTLARLLLWIKKQVLSEDDFNVIVSLVDHYEERCDRWAEIVKEDEDAILEPTLNTAYQVLQITNSKLGLGQVHKLLLKLYHNAGAICPPEYVDQYGTFFDLVISTINHCCDNNAHVFFEGRELRCRALKDIPAGTEITVSYYPAPRHDVLLRRNTLEEYMYIKCNCDRCKKEIAVHLAEAPKRNDHLRKVKEAQLKLDKLGLDAQKAFASYRVLKSCITYQDQVNAIVLKGYLGGRWPEQMEPLPHIYRELGGMYRDLGFAIGLEFVIKGTLYVLDKSDPNWVADLLSLVKFILFMAQAGENDINWLAAEDKKLMSRKDMRNVARGYVAILCVRAKFTFGSDTNFVRAVYHWAGKTLEVSYDHKIHTKLFREAFEESQKQVLKWANVSPDHALSLPSHQEIVKLKKETQAPSSTEKLGDALGAMKLDQKLDGSAPGAGLGEKAENVAPDAAAGADGSQK